MTVAEAIEVVLSLAKDYTRDICYMPTEDSADARAVEIVETIVLTHYKGVDDDTKGQ